MTSHTGCLTAWFAAAAAAGGCATEVAIDGPALASTREAVLDAVVARDFTGSARRLELRAGRVVVTDLEAGDARLTGVRLRASEPAATTAAVAGRSRAAAPEPGGRLTRYLDPEEGPVDVSADRAELRDGGRTAVFTGRVEVVRGTAHLTCHTLTARLGEAGRIDHLDCAGDVRLVQRTRRARAARATYQRGERTIVLTGDPVVEQDRSALRGERIVVHVDADRVEVTQARARLVPAETTPPRATAPTSPAADGGTKP
jgi:lipopolysaccharide transport protein LptA